MRDFKGMDLQPLAVAFHRFRTIKVCPKDIALVWQQSRPVNGQHKAAKGARDERHDRESGGEAGLDAALGHRMGDGLFNRDYPARASVGKRSGVSQRVYRTSARSTSN
jgi:hypothetical protein